MTWTLCTTPSRFTPDQLSILEFSSVDDLMSEFFEDALDPMFRTEKDGHAVIPAKPFSPRADGLYEDKGGQPTSMPYRRNANFSHITLAVVDFDCEERPALDSWLATLRQQGSGSSRTRPIPTGSQSSPSATASHCRSTSLSLSALPVVGPTASGRASWTIWDSQRRPRPR
ncbi:hypothetical protein DRW03_00060 [Corallococcus sp. H22C18031201]|nr:hypothetical protein DRW03_00060 [Corallococcus sp. H22C18031201]